MMVGNALLWVFLLPGNMVSDALGVAEADSRVMLRTLVNMLVWNFVAIMLAYAWQG